MYRILSVGGSGSRETNALFNLISQEMYNDKIYLYDKDPNEPKYQLLINKHENSVLNYFNDSKALVKYLNDMDDFLKNIEEYNPNKKRKILTLLMI